MTWKLGCIVSIVLLLCLLTVSLVAVGMTIQQSKTMKHAIESAMGGNTHEQNTSTPLTLPLPSVPSSRFTLDGPFALFGADLVSRLETGDALPPDGLETVAIFDSLSGVKNAWCCRVRDDPQTLWLVFRGTSNRAEWKKDFDFSQVPFLMRMMNSMARNIVFPKFSTAPTTSLDWADDGHVHSGFYDIYESMRNTMLDTMTSLVPRPTQVNITGHSMGGACSLLATLDVSTLFSDMNVDTVVFGCPRTGNREFCEALLARPNVHSLVCVCNTSDFVCDVPLAVQPNLNAPDTPFVYAHPRGTLHHFTDNRGQWVLNHMIGTYLDYLNDQ